MSNTTKKLKNKYLEKYCVPITDHDLIQFWTNEYDDHWDDC